MPRKIF